MTTAITENSTAAAIWEELEPLRVLRTDDTIQTPRQEEFYNIVEITPLLAISRGKLPEDLQDTGYAVVVKHEGRQPNGSYELRGVINALMARSVEVTDAAIANDATVHATHASLPDALDAATARGHQPGFILVHPYDHLKVVAGQGTVALEIADQLAAKKLNYGDITLFYPGGGAGIGAGNAVAGRMVMPHSRTRISQMNGADGIAKALDGEVLSSCDLVTSCDGAVVATPSEIAMRIIADPAFVCAVDVVSKAQVGEAMAILASVHEVPGPAGALALAATLKYMRANPTSDGIQPAHTLVAVTPEIMVTPAKVSEFMSAALSEGLIHGHTAGRVAMKAYAERSVHGLEEIVARRQLSKDCDRDDDTTQLRLRQISSRLLSGPTAAYNSIL